MNRETNCFFYMEKHFIGMIILQGKPLVDMRVVEFVKRENCRELAPIPGSMMGRRQFERFLEGGAACSAKS